MFASIVATTAGHVMAKHKARKEYITLCRELGVEPLSEPVYVPEPKKEENNHPSWWWLLLVVGLSGCQMGQTVLLSRGQTGGFSQIINGNIQYCKLSTTPGVEVTESDREAFRKYCSGNE